MNPTGILAIIFGLVLTGSGIFIVHSEVREKASHSHSVGGIVQTRYPPPPPKKIDAVINRKGGAGGRLPIYMWVIPLFLRMNL